MKKTTPNTIKVYCRLRPLNRLEKEQGGECCVKFTDEAIKVKVAGNDTPYDFTFDAIFGPDSTQIGVFQKVAEPVIIGLLEGYNGTIFAYGQTSSGKTFTMEGPDLIDSDDKLGIIPRMMNYIFSLMMKASEDIEFSVKVSFLELYNEKVQDLLDSRKNNLQIKEDKTKGIFVQDATEVYVSSAEEMKKVHKSGSENRTMAATRMNERSSRSHSVFVVSVDQKDTKTETTKHSKLYFVDLAGSEKISKTNVTGQQLEEAKNINKSLTALGLVINALTDKDKGHVPYRDSKLTRLLQESLGGNSQTSLILACSMCSYNDKETVDTLRFGNRAKSIKNCAVVNAERSAKELTILLSAAEKKIAEQDTFILSLKSQLAGGAPLSGEVTPRVNKDDAQNDENKSGSDGESKQEKPKPTASSGSSGASSLFMLKNQIEMASLKEELAEANAANKELEAEVSAKNKEIYELNGKILQYESQISEFANKNVFAIEEYQVQFEKLYHENQEKLMLASKFKRAIQRLKADLNFSYISKSLMSMESPNGSPNKKAQPDNGDNLLEAANNNELIGTSIKKTLEMLEEIEREIDENHNAVPNEEMSNMIDSLMKNSSNKSEINSPPFKSEIETIGTDEQVLGWITDAYDEDNNSDETVDNSKFETEADESILISGQFQNLTEEEKINKLNSLIANQRKTINSLTKTNADLSHTNQKQIAAHDDMLQKFKAKAEEWQKTMKEKSQDAEQKITSLKTVLEAKINEIENNRKQYEKYLFDKDGMVAELKEQNEKLHGLIANNEEAMHNYELENTLKKYVAERKRLAEEVFAMRKEVDEKDDIITQKTGQIELLQNNLGLAAKEIKMLKSLKASVAEIPPPMSARQSTKDQAKDSKRSSKTKNDFVLFDKNIIKPIRGGGGDANKFVKNNALVLDRPARLETEPEERKAKEERKIKMVEPPKTTRASLLSFNFNFGDMKKPKAKEAEAVSATKETKEVKDPAQVKSPTRSSPIKDDSSFKKFEEVLAKKGDSGRKQRQLDDLRISTEGDEDEDYESEEMKQRMKLITGRGNQSGKKLQSLFNNVKNLFS